MPRGFRKFTFALALRMCDSFLPQPHSTPRRRMVSRHTRTQATLLPASTPSLATEADQRPCDWSQCAKSEQAFPRQCHLSVSAQSAIQPTPRLLVSFRAAVDSIDENVCVNQDHRRALPALSSSSSTFQMKARLSRGRLRRRVVARSLDEKPDRIALRAAEHGEWKPEPVRTAPRLALAWMRTEAFTIEACLEYAGARDSRPGRYQGPGETRGAWCSLFRNQPPRRLPPQRRPCLQAVSWPPLHVRGPGILLVSSETRA
jgi:hypothetical protein